MDAAFQALVDQAKRVSARHPELLARYLAAIRDKARGMPADQVEALLKEVSGAAAAAEGRPGEPPAEPR